MNWKLIILLSLTGLILGFATVFGFLGTGLSRYLWVLIDLLLAVVIGQFAGQKYFWNGFMVGVISGILSSAVTLLMFDTYLANNPEVGEALDKAREALPEFDMRWTMMIGAPIGAAVSGLVLGLMSILAGKLFGPKPATATPAAPPPDENIPQP